MRQQSSGSGPYGRQQRFCMGACMVVWDLGDQFETARHVHARLCRWVVGGIEQIICREDIRFMCTVCVCIDDFISEEMRVLANKHWSGFQSMYIDA